MEITKNNFFRPSGIGKNFTIEIDPITRSPLSYREEVIRNAKEIWNNKEGTLYCMYSGGIDSEIILEIYKHLDLPIIPVIMDFKYNKMDINHAFAWCNKNSVKPVVVNIDIINFINSKVFLDLAIEVGASEFAYLHGIYTAMSLSGTVLWGLNDIPLIYSPKEQKWNYKFRHSPSIVHRAYEKKLIHGTHALLGWTPETMLSYLLDEDVKKLIDGKYPNYLTSKRIKRNIYNNIHPIENRPKYTGFEYLLTQRTDILELPNMVKIKEFENGISGEFKIEYHDLIERLKN